MRDVPEDGAEEDFFAANLFEEPSAPERFFLEVGGRSIHANFLSKENQHTFKATGLMVWESAYAMGSLLAANSPVVEGKRVLELGCGCVAICSLISSLHAEKVIATDGDKVALDLLRDNMMLNAASFPVDRIECHQLRWGNRADLDAVMNCGAAKGGIDVVIGTEVTYVMEAVPLLFQTAQCLLQGVREGILILCHVTRRVSEADILDIAAEHGFELRGVFSLDGGKELCTGQGNLSMEFVRSLFTMQLESSMAYSSTALRLLCFAIKGCG